MIVINIIVYGISVIRIAVDRFDLVGYLLGFSSVSCFLGYIADEKGTGSSATYDCISRPFF